MRLSLSPPRVWVSEMFPPVVLLRSVDRGLATNLGSRPGGRQRLQARRAIAPDRTRTSVPTFLRREAAGPLVVLDACGTAHYWGRQLQDLGQRMRLLLGASVPARMLLTAVARSTSSSSGT